MIDIFQLFAYHNWANERLCTMLHNAFGDEQNLSKSYSAVVLALQQTAVHMVAAEQIWRKRLEGESPKEMLNPADYPTVPDIRAAFEKEREAVQAVLASLKEESDFERIVTSYSTKGELRVYPVKAILYHMVNHATYHRGQITARLIDLGHDKHVLLTDYVFFVMEQSAE
jgi:uncharacterized damage-inducible protein DinB